MTTQIHWHSAHIPPDDDQTVLVHLADGEVWTGFRDARAWRFVSGDKIESRVLHWAAFPAPPPTTKKSQ